MMIALFTLLGLAVGSFFNLCIDRLPRDESIITPPSHCQACAHRLGFFDLIPVFSYIWLRGRCRYCGTALPKRLPIVELSSACIFGLLCWNYGLHPELWMSLIYASILLVIFVIDIEHGLILDKVIYPSMVLALILSTFWIGASGWPDVGVLSALLGGVACFALMLIPYLAYPEGMGRGDVKLAAFGGLATGFPLGIIALLVGVVGGGIVALALLVTRVRGRKEAIPFGPFLAAGIMATLIWGQNILSWYLSFF